MTSQTPLVTQPASKCLVIGLCSPGFIGGAPTYLCQRRCSLRCELFRALLKVERRANDGMRTSEHLIWTRPRVSAGGRSFGSEQRAATQQRWELHTVSVWTRSSMLQPRRTPTSVSEVENETTQVEVLLCCRWEFATPAALLHFLLIFEVMRHEIYSPAVKMIFPLPT